MPGPATYSMSSLDAGNIDLMMRNSAYSQLSTTSIHNKSISGDLDVNDPY